MAKMIKEVCTSSPEETEKLGEELASAVRDGNDSALPRFIALYGDLGVGKTAFARGFVRVFSPNACVRSPTFALVNEYPSDICRLYHFDMYRITSEDDLYSIGYYDYLDDKNAVCLVEWSENIPYALPKSYLRVRIEKNDPKNEGSRRITVETV